jgi:hypothetical protein
MHDHPFTDEPESVFAAMRRQIALTPIPDPQPATLRERLASHPRLAAGGAGALVAAATIAAATLASGALTDAPPAFALTTTQESVTITLNDLGARGSLNAKLAADNIPIRAVPVVAGCTATVQAVGADGTTGPPQTLQAGSASGPATITIVLNQRPAPGDTLVVGVSSTGHWVLGPHKITGRVPSCVGESNTSLPKRRQHRLTRHQA